MKSGETSRYTKDIELDDCGKCVEEVKPGSYIINRRITMVVKAPRGTLALFEEVCFYGGEPWSTQAEMLRNFMAAHPCTQKLFIPELDIA